MDSISIDTLPGPACIVEASVITRSNRLFDEWIGQGGGAVAGRALDELCRGEPKLGEALAEALELGDSFEHHVCRRGRAGHLSFWSIRARRMGEGVLVWAADMTAFAKVVQATSRAQRVYGAALSRELRAPLCAIKAWAATVASNAGAASEPETARAPAVREALEVIGKEVDRMDALLSDLLQMVRSEQSTKQPALLMCPLSELLRNAMARAGDEIVVTVPEEEPRAVVMVDPQRVEIAMAKLFSCVGKRQGGAPIEITFERAEGEILISIIDRGPPVPTPIHKALFGPFQQTSREPGGGLTLALCQQLVIAGGGRIWFEPYAGPARFVLALPEHKASSKREQSSPATPPAVLISPESWEQPSVSAHARSEPSSMAPHLLVADPCPELLSQMVSVLRLWGYDVQGTSLGDLFWKALADHPVDLVIVDLSVPGLGGGEAGLARIRKSPSAPLVLCTADASELVSARNARFERHGAHALVPKPIDWLHLSSLLRSSVAARRGFMDAA